MALMPNGSIWIFQGRPCLVEGHGTKTIPPRAGARWHSRSWNVNRIRFLDGNNPLTADIAEVQFSQRARTITGAKRDYFQRIADLHAQGLMMIQAVRQATAELAKGVGAADIMDGV